MLDQSETSLGDLIAGGLEFHDPSRPTIAPPKATTETNEEQHNEI